MNYLKFSSLPETCIFMIWTSRKSFIRLGHATADQKHHFGLIHLRIFKMRWVSFANDHLGHKPLISDSATRRSLWPLECQPVALDDNKWQISKTLIQSSIQTHGQVSKKSYFDIWHFWKSYCCLRLIWGLDHRSRSRSRSRRSQYILPGAGVAEQFYLEPEPEPACFPGAGAGAGADQQCHGSASLLSGFGEIPSTYKLYLYPGFFYIGHTWRIVWKCGCRSTHFAVVHPQKWMEHPWRTTNTVSKVRHGCFINFCGCTTAKWVLRHPHFHTIIHLWYRWPKVRSISWPSHYRGRWGQYGDVKNLRPPSLK